MRTAARIAESEALLALSLKRCGKCAQVLHLSTFYKAKSGLGGVRAACKACLSAQTTVWKQANREVVRAAERQRLKSSEGRAKREVVMERHLAKYREVYRLKAEQKRRSAGVPVRPVGRQTPIEVLRKRCRDYKAQNREKMRAYQRRILQTPEGKIRNRIRARMRECLRLGHKNSRTFKLLGYTIQELRTHLERQFLPGMGWHNMDEWHIDHIVPLSSFEVSGENDPELRRAWALTNLRPLWAKDNLAKSDKRLTLI